MHEFILGIDHELAKDFRVGLQFVHKVNKNIVEDIDINNGYDPDATMQSGPNQGDPIWLPFTFTDPGWDGDWDTTEDNQELTVYALADYAPTRTYMGSNPPEANRKYTALILSFDKAAGLDHVFWLQRQYRSWIQRNRRRVKYVRQS
jgi:hypothetical protein